MCWLRLKTCFFDPSTLCLKWGSVETYSDPSLMALSIYCCSSLPPLALVHFHPSSSSFFLFFSIQEVHFKRVVSSLLPKVQLVLHVREVLKAPEDILSHPVFVNRFDLWPFLQYSAFMLHKAGVGERNAFDQPLSRFFYFFTAKLTEHKLFCDCNMLLVTLYLSHYYRLFRLPVQANAESYLLPSKC